MKKLSVVASVIVLGMVSYLNAAVHEMFPQEAARGGMAMAPQAAAPGADALRSRIVPHAQTRVLPAMADQAVYPFFSDVAYTTTVTRVTRGFGNAEIVEGKTEDTIVKSLTVYTPEGVRHEIHGAPNGLVYVAVSLPDGTMMMQEFAPSREPHRCGNDDDDASHFNDGRHLAEKSPLDEIDPQMTADILALAAAGDTEVDLMMVFDTGATAWAQGSGGGVAAMANSAVSRMNTALANSGIACTIRLVHIYLPNYTFAGSLSFTLDDVILGRVGLNGVAARRATCGADVVTMMVDTGSDTGTTGIGVTSAADNTAFSVCAVRAVNAGNTMAHEVGHNFGCGHSRTLSGGTGSTIPYAAGLNFTAVVLFVQRPTHTIMAYNYDNSRTGYQPCDLFSSPSLSFLGTPLGTANSVDNARVIRENMARLAGFRAPAGLTTVLVNFNTQSGSMSQSLLSYFHGRAYESLPFPFRAGYTFDGWYTGTSGSGTKITENSIASTSVTTLYAKWLSGWNDNFANAAVISGTSGAATGANVGASRQSGEPNPGSAGYSVWWKWTAPASGAFEFDTHGSSFDTVLAVYTGSAVSALTEVAKNDNSGGDVTSAVAFNAVSGTTYYFMVDGKTSSGAIKLNWKTGPFQMNSPGDFFSSEGAVKAVTVTAFGAWSVSKPVGATWVTCPASGNGSASFQFTVAQNPTDVYRATALTFTCGAATKTYEILQNSQPWKTSKSDAMSSAAAAGKKVLLMGGSFTNSNTRTMRTEVCENEEVKKALKAGYVLWFCDIGTSTEHAAYATGLGNFPLPLICVIDPATPSAYQDRTTGTQTASAFLARIISGAGIVTVTFDAQGGDGSLPAIYAKPGSTYGDLPTPTRTGYAFAGWYTAAGSGGSPVSAQTTVANTSDHTLYAGWTSTGASSVATFNAQGGSVSPASKSVSQGAAYGALPIPTWAGHLFMGWYTAANGGGSRILDSTLVSASANHTLHAKWASLAPNATVYYVDADLGNDSRNGLTPADAKKTIQAAVGLANTGDAILVLDGVYAPISTSNKSITIQGMNGAERTIIDGGNSQRCATLGSVNTDTNTTLTGFTLRNGRTSDNGGGTAYGTVTGCVFTNNLTSGGGVDYGHGGGSYYGVLDRCKFVDNKANNWGGGSYYGTINNSLYLRNKAFSGGGAAMADINNCTVKDNTATSSSDAGGGLYLGTAKNCILWGNTSAGAANNHMWSSVSYTCTAPAPSGGNNIDDDPMFADDEGRLAHNSPCRNAGHNTYAVGGFDLDGNARIQAATVDLGAYEFLAAVITTSFSPVPVPYSWINDYYIASTSAEYENIATNSGANGVLVWQSYVACLNPTSLTSRFTAGINFTNGVPEITCDPYRPDIRDYEVIGGATLDNVNAWGTTNSDSRFFRVKVRLR